MRRALLLRETGHGVPGASLLTPRNDPWSDSRDNPVEATVRNYGYTNNDRRVLRFMLLRECYALLDLFSLLRDEFTDEQLAHYSATLKELQERLIDDVPSPTF